MLRATPLFLAALACLSACDGSSSNGPEDDPCDPPSKPSEFEIGTGEQCFERLAADGEIPLMNGPQGGYHLWLAIGCADCGEEVRLRYGARDPMTNDPLTGTYVVEEITELSGSNWQQAAGIQVSMPGLSWDEMSDPPPQKGTPLVLWAEVRSSSGETLHEAEVPVTIGDTMQWDPCDGGSNSEACSGRGF